MRTQHTPLPWYNLNSASSTSSTTTATVPSPLVLSLLLPLSPSVCSGLSSVRSPLRLIFRCSA
eukprot:649945-Rhodomonas_salina.1